MNAKDFDKAVILHQTKTHALAAAIGRKDEPIPRGVGLFEAHDMVPGKQAHHG